MSAPKGLNRIEACGEIYKYPKNIKLIHNSLCYNVKQLSVEVRRVTFSMHFDLYGLPPGKDLLSFHGKILL